MSPTALQEITRSSKATVLVVVLALLAVGHFVGRIETKDYLQAVEVLVGVWMAARAYEQRGKT